MRKWMRLLAPLVALGLVAASCGDGDNDGKGSDGAPAAPGEYPRHETLYTSGTQWGPPSNWNPIMNWAYAPGTIGLVYETLFLYDPLTDEYIPWLATSGEWVSDEIYEVTLREGVTWADGEAFDAEDVVFTVELGKMPSVPFAPLWDWLESVEAVDSHTVRFTFSNPRYQQWANFIYFHPMVPEHIWRDFAEEDVTGGANEDPIGTGPYRYLTHSDDRMVWKRELVAEEARYDVAPARRHRQPQQRGGSGLGDPGRARPEQQLPAWHQEIIQGDFDVVSYRRAAVCCREHHLAGAQQERKPPTT